MSQRLAGTDAHLGPQLQHLAQQVQPQCIHLRQDRVQALRRKVVEVRLVLGKLADTGPGALRRRAHEAEDLLQLIVVGRAGEQRPAGVHLRHDAAGGPDVDAGIVGAGAEQDVRGAVPQRDDLVGEGIDGDAKRPRQPEIRKLELALGVDEQVLRLQVAVQDAVVVAEGDATQQLLHEGLDGDVVELAAVAAGVHVLFQVFVHVLEDEHEFVLGVDDVVEGNDVFVFEFFHQGDLADGGRGGAFFGVEVDFFEGDELAGLAVAAFEDLGLVRGSQQAGLGVGCVLWHRFLHRAVRTSVGPRYCRFNVDSPFPAAGRSWDVVDPYRRRRL